MKKLMAHTSIRFILGFWFIVSFIFLGDSRIVKAEESVTVEGEWEIISMNIDALRKEIGQRVLISRKGDGYEVKGNSSEIYSGNETRITHTFLDDLGERGPGSEDIPSSVLQQVAGQKVPINISYTLSVDGNFLQMESDYVWFYYGMKTEHFDHYEIEPGYIKKTLKRISGPVSKASQAKERSASSVAQVESRGEFYFLTKDGRKVIGEEASKVPLEEGTKVVTGSDGHIKMTLPDNTTFTVGPNSDFVIDKFVYDPATDTQAVTANLSKGVFRWVTGKIVHKDPTQMKVVLPVGDLGIRGTDFEAAVEPNGSGSVVLYFGQLEITEKKTGFKFLLEAGQKVSFGAEGSFSRPIEIK